MDEQPIEKFADALRGMDFPAPKEAIVRKVQVTADASIASAAELLPDRVYEWERDAHREFARIVGGEHAVAPGSGLPFEGIPTVEETAW